MTQFAYGFPLVGNLSQTGVYPRDMDVLPAPPVGRISAKSSDRFSSRAKHSGYLHSMELWGESPKQVESGWLGAPLPIDTSGNVLTYGHGSANIAFLFGVDHADKLRACDDLKHNHVDRYCSVWAPIKLPTWDRIAQMCLGVKEDLRERPFFKADRESAYKQLPMGPKHHNLAMGSIRNPDTGERAVFPPKALLFGAVAAVLRYNCFSRLPPAMFNKIFGIPMVGYFDDFGALVPSKLAPLALRTFGRFCGIIGIQLKVTKTECANSLVSLRLKGGFPKPPNGALRHIEHPRPNAATWINMIRRVVGSGSVSHMELESIIGRLFFTQTSVFGRIGRGMVAPLYAKLRTFPYRHVLSPKESTTLRWWTVAIDHMKPRVATPKPKLTKRVVYTDADGKSQIIDAVIIDPITFAESKTIKKFARPVQVAAGSRPSGIPATFMVWKCRHSCPH